jgi:cyclopropane fatty-acyl-phospholipid synthase-like methyltransferase
MSFDRLAPHYRWMELALAGEKLQRCRRHFLNRIQKAENILLLGEGHGRFLAECLAQFPETNITCVDASEGMLNQCRARVHGTAASRVTLIHTDVLQWTPRSVQYDLIASHFFFDCFRAEEIKSIVGNISSSASHTAAWLISDFQLAHGGARQVRSRLILWSMYLFFRAVTKLPASQLATPDVALEQAGWTLISRAESEWDLLRSDLWQKGQ